MTLFTLILLLIAAAVLSVMLLAAVSRFGDRFRPLPRSGLGLSLLLLGWINVAGGLGIATLVAETLRYDGWMAEEIGIGAGLIALLGGLTAGALTLRRRRRPFAALLTIALGAVPTVAVFALLVYVQAYPIDWR